MCAPRKQQSNQFDSPPPGSGRSTTLEMGGLRTFPIILRAARMPIALLPFVLLAGLATASAQESEEPSADEDAPAAIILDPGEELPPFYQPTPDDPAVPWQVDQVGEFELLDQDGNTVTLESLKGKPWVANFVFSRCTYQCPWTCRKIMELNEELKNVDVRFVTITVDPEHDTVDVLKEYASVWKADPERWLFLTGEPEDVWNLIRKGFKVSAWENVGTERTPGMEFAHSNHMLHVDENGRIVGRYDSGDDLEMVTLKKVLRGQTETPMKHRPATQEAIAKLEAQRAAAAAADNESTELPTARERNEEIRAQLPRWVRVLPTLNASLNGLALLLLIAGFIAIKLGEVHLHKRMMLTAFVVSSVFLVSYLTYHFAVPAYSEAKHLEFAGSPEVKPVYYGILISHIVLAATVPVLAIITIYNGLKAWPEDADEETYRTLLQERYNHSRWAKWTFPIWVYVSVTGVIIYFMLYWM